MSLSIFPGIRRPAKLLVFLVAVVGCCAAKGEDYGSLNNTLPKSMEGVGIDQKLGEVVPLDLQFTCATPLNPVGEPSGAKTVGVGQIGLKTSIRELLRDGRPVLLTLNYGNCPGMCIAQLNGLVRGLNELSSVQLGKDFAMVSISIDPSETVAKASATHQRYAQDLFDHHDATGWQFWVGDKESISTLTDAVGFRYTYDAKHNQFNHPSAAIFIAPNGTITRYVFEIGFVANTLKMAFVEAGQGRVGSPLDMIALWCAHFDANENRYSTSARRLMSVGAGLFVTLGAIVSLPFWLVRRNQTEKKTRPTGSQASGGPVGAEAPSTDNDLKNSVIN
jgi:protein SCO1/2